MKYKILQGGCLTVLKAMESESVNCVVTSPPYWALRDYGVAGQLGLEPTFQGYIAKLCDIFDEVKRVLRKDGTCFVNLGDTYSGMKQGNTETTKNKKVVSDSFTKPKSNLQDKCLCQIPSRFAIDMTNRGWILRNEIIWQKHNCMPSSAKDRFTVDFEKLFFFTKNKKYYFEPQLEPAKDSSDMDYRQALGRKNADRYSLKAPYKGNFPKKFRDDNMRSRRAVWVVNTKPFKGAHFATFPEALVETPIKAGCPVGGVVLDPFMGSGTTAVVALKQGKNAIGVELNAEYIKIAEDRIAKETLGDFL